MTQDAINRRIIDGLTTAVLVFDDVLRLIYVNPAGEMVFEVSARRLLGLPVQDLLPGAALVVDAMRYALESGAPFAEHELQLALPGGRKISVDMTITPLAEGRGGELLVELVQVDRQMRITREENLLAQLQAARAVVRGLAHEIKNPLGGLRGAAQLLERELVDEALTEYTGIIIGEADRLQNLVNRILGPNTLSQKRLANIHQVLERVRGVVLAEVPTGVSIIRDYDPSIPEFSVDPDQLIQAVLNIVRNAVQAIDGAGDIILRTRIQRQITIGQQRHKLAARIEVIDSGPGIAPDMVERIFYPMVTTRPEGTGLGLSIAQSLVQQHDGLIECSSHPGQTTFTIVLPLEKGNE
ncbi:MAG: nitrogen regulation protein NR(II) [Gammaproteobacteria bacterium]|nr:nitrogen regulation protein NR(II) [Gammaproteobacteria bacterium]